MKISILTSTYKRGKELKNLYRSIIKNSDFGGNVEWLIMDDGSEDDTEQVVTEMDKQYPNLQIHYYKHENKGKMASVNELVAKSEGDLIIECDSDDYFSDNAFEIINESYEKYKNEKGIYALCFLKYNTKNENIGKNMPKEKTTMFDLYFKDLEDGEKALVFFSGIRKKYEYRLEKKEKFVTEARMHHEMDINYNIICINKPIMICEYKKDGYTRNIQKIFQDNPYGYYEYFKEILERNMTGVTLKKRIYVIKHYILFSYLTKQRMKSTEIKNIINKILILLLHIPGIIKTKSLIKEK